MIVSTQVIQTDGAPSAIGPYSQAIQAGPWLFVSGQIGLKPETGEMVSEEFPQQAQQVLDNLTHIVKAAGYALTDVVAVDVFMTDLARFSLFNEIYQNHFAGHKPARAVVEVKALPKGAKIEIKCIAYKP
jgi:2-iminobutanoate/2-iminopropanoate deaminase